MIGSVCHVIDCASELNVPSWGYRCLYFHLADLLADLLCQFFLSHSILLFYCTCILFFYRDGIIGQLNFAGYFGKCVQGRVR